MKTSTSLRNNDAPVCPCCGHLESDAWEINFGGGLDGDAIITCGGCNEEYFVERVATIQYHSTALENVMDTVKQPSDNDLHAAWSHAISAEGIAGAHGEGLQTLRDLRTKRTTWFGEKENELRGSLDKYLEYYHA